MSPLQKRDGRKSESVLRETRNTDADERPVRLDRTDLPFHIVESSVNHVDHARFDLNFLLDAIRRRTVSRFDPQIPNSDRNDE